MVTDHSFPQGSGTTNWPLTCSSSARQLRARSLPKDAVPLAGFCCRLRIDCSIAIARGYARNRRKRQTVKRASLVVTLCAALCVSAGFAATKKSHRNNGPRDWNDLSLQNGDLSSNWGDLSLQNGGLPIRRTQGRSTCPTARRCPSTATLTTSTTPTPRMAVPSLTSLVRLP